MRALLRASFLILIFGLSACVSPYERFYQGRAPVAENALRPGVEPRVIPGSNDPQRDTERMFEEGYVLIGRSQFVDAAQDTAGAVSQAKQVGAELVITYATQRNTATGQRPMTRPSRSTTSSSRAVTGDVGSEAYSGSTTPSASETEDVVDSVEKYDQGASYFVRNPRRGLGVLLKPLKPPTNGQQRMAGTNRGMQIVAVCNGSPASRADIMPGDVLFSVDGKPVYDQPTAHSAIAASAGRRVKIVVIRKSGKVSKTVAMPANTW